MRRRPSNGSQLGKRTSFGECVRGWCPARSSKPERRREQPLPRMSQPKLLTSVASIDVLVRLRHIRRKIAKARPKSQEMHVNRSARHALIPREQQTRPPPTLGAGRFLAPEPRRRHRDKSGITMKLIDPEQPIDIRIGDGGGRTHVWKSGKIFPILL
jgi:hypothetical protein